MKIISYFQLLRPEIVLVAFATYLTGAEIADRIDFYDIFVAAAVALISTNFIYTFNSWADRYIDKIDKPFRPIPSGKIKPREALIYSIILLILSMVFPFFVYKSLLTLILFILLPVLGILYSAEPIRLRSYPIAATAVITIGLHIPLMLGYYMNSSNIHINPFFVVIFIMGMCVIPLKATEEAELDKKIGAPNLFLKYGNKLLLFSLGALVLVFILTVLLDFDQRFKVYLFVMIPTVAGLIIFYLIHSSKTHGLYRSLTKFVITEGAIITIILIIF